MLKDFEKLKNTVLLVPLEHKHPVFLNGKKRNVTKIIFLYWDSKNRIKVTRNIKINNLCNNCPVNALHKKMKFSIKDFFSKCEQIRRKLRIWSHLLKKSLMDNFIFCAVMSKDLLKVAVRS